MSGLIDSIPDNKALSKPVALGSADTLKVTLTAQEGSSPKQANQVFLLFQDPETGLDISYPFSVKNNGKSRLELVSSALADSDGQVAIGAKLTDTVPLQAMKDLPLQFLAPSKPLEARFLIGSFGTSAAYNGVAFPLTVARDPNVPVPTVEVSRYGKLPEIHHIFKADAQSPPVVITLVFVAMALACLPVLGGVVSQCSVQHV